MAIDHLPGVARSAKRHRVAQRIRTRAIQHSVDTELKHSSAKATEAISGREWQIAADRARKLGIDRTIRAMSALTRRNASRRPCGLRPVGSAHGLVDIATHAATGFRRLCRLAISDLPHGARIAAQLGNKVKNSHF